MIGVIGLIGLIGLRRGQARGAPWVLWGLAEAPPGLLGPQGLLELLPGLGPRLAAPGPLPGLGPRLAGLGLLLSLGPLLGPLGPLLGPLGPLLGQEALGQSTPGPMEAWRSVGPPGIRDLVDVAIHPERPGTWVGITATGGVWHSRDAGLSWHEILAPIPGMLSSDEDRLIDVEGRLGELTGAPELLDGSDLTGGDLEAYEDELAELEAAARDAAAQLQSELEGDPWFLQADPDEIETRPRVRFSSGGDLLVARRDGLLRQDAERLGEIRAWSALLDTPVTSVAELGGADGPGSLVIGSPGGVFGSLGALGLVPLVPELEGIAIHDLVQDRGLFIASDAGLWRVVPGRAPEQLATGEVLTARWIGGRGSDALGPAVVIGRSRGLGRIEGVSGAPEVQVAALAGVRSIALHPDGGLIAASLQGVFRSTDGVTWVPWGRGLAGGIGGEVPRVVSRGSVVLLASSEGLHQLGEQRPDALLVGPVPWIPLSVLLEASLARPGLTARPGTRWIAAVMPQITASYQRRDERGSAWDTDSWTTQGVQGYWLAAMSLTWRPGRASTSSGDDPLQVFTIGDDLVVDDGISPAVLFGRVSRSAIRYRDELAAQISGLYRTRQALAAGRADPRRRTLLQRVQLQLQLDEVEAQLDALTHGVVSARAATHPDPIP